MGHAEHPVTALHGKELERPHDVGAQGCKGAVADLAPDARQPDTAPPPGKPTAIRPQNTAPHRQTGYCKLPRALRGEHLHKGSALRLPGDERHHDIPFLMLEIPAHKTFLPTHFSAPAFLLLLYSVCATPPVFYSAAAGLGISSRKVLRKGIPQAGRQNIFYAFFKDHRVTETGSIQQTAPGPVRYAQIPALFVAEKIHCQQPVPISRAAW